MEIIKVTEDRMNRVLPKNIIECDVLSKDAKKVLATIVNYIFVQQKAKSQGYLVIANNTLAKSVGISSKYYLMNALQELIDCGLIERKAGKAWQKGNVKMASEYWVNWEALNKPIEKKGFEELYEQFLKESKSSETPILSTISNTISTPVSKTTSITVPNTISTPVDIPVDVHLPHTHKKHNEDELKKDLLKKELEAWANKVNEERIKSEME